MKHPFAAVCVLLVFSLIGAAQDQPKSQRPVFRGGTQLVRVDAYPVSKDGRIIEGLTADISTARRRRRR